MAARAERPVAANSLRKVLRAMMRHAVEIGLRADDPTRDVRAIRVRTDGFHSWNDDEIAQFEKRHPTGTPARLALALLLYTGQRRSDVVRMGSSISATGYWVSANRKRASSLRSLFTQRLPLLSPRRRPIILPS